MSNDCLPRSDLVKLQEEILALPASSLSDLKPRHARIDHPDSNLHTF
jgi:hypothetical protein